MRRAPRAGLRLLAIIPVPASPVGVAITPDGALAYVTHSTSGSASVISTATNRVVDTILGLHTPFGIALAQLAVPPRSHRPPPGGTILGIAEKSFVEVCNAYTGGFGPTASVRVIAQVQQQASWRTLDNFTVSLTEGACQDVWFNPLDASTRILITELPIIGFTPSCTVNQVGPGSAKVAKACPNATQALVFTNLDTGFLVEYTNR